MKPDKVLFSVVLADKHQPTGKTRPYIGWLSNRKLPSVPYSLAIVQLNGGPGFYLYYLDSNGKDQTDTYHSTIKQAEFEFNVKDSDWERPARERR